MAKDSKKVRKKKGAPPRRRFKTPRQTQDNLKSIAEQQLRYRKQKRKFKQRRAGDETKFKPQIIENIEKSERAWNNELRKITRQEDLDGFED